MAVEGAIDQLESAAVEVNQHGTPAFAVEGVVDQLGTASVEVEAAIEQPVARRRRRLQFYENYENISSSDSSYQPSLDSFHTSPETSQEGAFLRTDEVEMLENNVLAMRQEQENEELQEVLAASAQDQEREKELQTALIELRHEQLQATQEEANDEQRRKCSICYESLFTEKRQTATFVSCGHIFHESCIKVSLAVRNKCAICNVEVSQVVPIYLP